MPILPIWTSAKSIGFDARYTFNDPKSSCPFEQQDWRKYWLAGWLEADAILLVRSKK